MKIRALVRRPDPSQIVRPWIIFALVVIGFSLLFIRLVYLQVFSGKEYRLMSEENRIRVVMVPAVRGIISDRYGNIIVDSRPSFDVVVAEEFVDDLDATLGSIASMCGVDEKTLRVSLERERKINPKYRPLAVIRDLPRDSLAPLIARVHHMSGVSVEVRPTRNYPFGAIAPHLVGYLGEIEERDLVREEYSEYRIGDIIGKGGIEAYWDRELRGSDGGVQMEVDSSGRELSVLGRVDAVCGNNLVLTIDAKLQEFTARLMEEREYTGSVIVMNPQNFEVLTMVSAPMFDPTNFADGIDPDTWRRLVEDPGHPLENKGISGQYPPGSTYKLITASAGLGEGIIDEEKTLYCPGSFYYGGRYFSCWKAGGHGKIEIHRAIVESCDVFFYKVGEAVGIDRLAAYGSGYGFGKLTGIKIPNEKPGLVPSTEWKKGSLGQGWFPGETISCAIGQGYNLVTPLQLLAAFCALANGGTLMEPLVVKMVMSPAGETMAFFDAEKKGKIPISKKTIDIIKKGLYGAVNESGGTGGRARLEGNGVCGKTGTAQVISGKMRSEYLPPELRDHAWFVCFAPFEKPEVAVVVIVEHGGFGGSTAAPIAGAVLKKYFELKAERKR